MICRGGFDYALHGLENAFMQKVSAGTSLPKRQRDELQLYRPSGTHLQFKRHCKVQKPDLQSSAW